MKYAITTLLLLAIVFLVGCTQSTVEAPVEEVVVEQPEVPAEPVEEIEETVEETVGETAEPTDAPEEIMDDVKTFIVTGENFKFVLDGQDNPDIVVSEGDTVRIEFSSTDGFHDWVVDEFDAATEKVRPDAGITTVEFVADQAGEFEYYCSVGSHRQQGMKGKLIVQ